MLWKVLAARLEWNKADVIDGTHLSLSKAGMINLHSAVKIFELGIVLITVVSL